MFHEVSICKKLTYINNISHRSGSDLKKSYVPLGQQIIRWEHIPTIRTDAEASSNGQEIACEKSKYNRGKSRLYIDRKKESAHWCGFFVCKKGGKEKELRQFFTFFLSYDWFGFRQKKKKQQRRDFWFHGDVMHLGAKARFKRNVEAVRLLKHLERENRLATETEQ